MQVLILVFPPISQLATASNLVMFGLAILLAFFRSLTDGYCFHGAIKLNWLEKIINQPFHSQNFDMTSYLGYFLIMSFIADF